MSKVASQVQRQVSGSSVMASGILQRKCACGNHTVAGGECTECGKSKNDLHSRGGDQSAPWDRFSPSRVPVMQAKFTVGRTNDPLEQEADWIADQVLAAPTHTGHGHAGPHIQRFAGQTTGQTDAAPASVERALASPGSPLDPMLQHDMQKRFGYDFSRVRTHSGIVAEQSARDLNALAYTVGQSIVFGAGQFSPETPGGRRLLAHELTHVVQQSGAEGIHPGLGVRKRGLSPNNDCVVRRSTTYGAGGCASSVTEVDEDDSGPKAAGRRAHDQIQTYLLPILNEVQVPRATKRRIGNVGCQELGTQPGFADLMRRSGIANDFGEIKPIGSALARGVLESEHYVRRADQSAGRLFGTGTCGAAGDDDRLFQSDIFRGRLRPTFGKLTGVLPQTTMIGPFVGDRTRTLKARLVAPGAVGYWCTGGRSDTYTCGASPEETAAYIDRMVAGPAQEVLDRFVRERIQQPLERTLRRQSLGDLVRLAERHFGTQIRQMLRPYIGPVANQVLSRASAEQVAQLIDQAVGAEARAVVTTLVRMITDALISELRAQLRNVLTELVRSALAALCVGVPAVALADLLDKLRDLLRQRVRQLIPVVVTTVAARIVSAIMAELAGILAQMVEAIGETLGAIGRALLFIGAILLRVLAAIAIAVLAVGAVIAGVLALITLFDPVPGDEAALAAATVALLGLIPVLGRFVATGSTEEQPEGA